MPVQLLTFSFVAYPFIGLYRLLHDESLLKPMLASSGKTLKWFGFGFIPYALIAYPIAKLYLRVAVRWHPLSTRALEDSTFFMISPLTFSALASILGIYSYGPDYLLWLLRCTDETILVRMLIEFMLKKQLKKYQKEVWDKTLISRGKGAEFWLEYVEEWKEPPMSRAIKNQEKVAFYKNLSSPLVRFFILRVLLLPFSFIPFLPLIISALLRSLTLGRQLHEPYFKLKNLTPLQTELFIIERQNSYRVFGFTSALLERVPILGLFFSISNRVGSAMLAFDLEKNQKLFLEGTKEKTKVYKSKSASLPDHELGELTPLENIGGFPRKSGKIYSKKDL